MSELAPRLDARLLVASGYLAGTQVDLPGYRPLERVEAEGWAAEVFSAETQ